MENADAIKLVTTFSEISEHYIFTKKIEFIFHCYSEFFLYINVLKFIFKFKNCSKKVFSCNQHVILY